MSLWRNLVSEAHRRSIWQVFIGYTVTAWVIFQVVATMYDALGLPRWVPPLTLILLLIGLPIVLVTAYVQRAGPRPADLFIGGSDPTLHPELEGLQPTPAQRRITWRRSLLGGLAAFALLAIAATTVVTMRNLGIGPLATLVAQGVIAEDDRVVLADFASPADSALGKAIAQAIRIDLLQSDLINIAEPTDIATTLRLMKREPDGPLDEATARDVAQRAGYKAVLTGEVGALGSGYTLNARLLSPEGNTLAAFREAARDSTELVDAVQRLSSRLREKVGESLKSIRASAPLASVSTSSLAALRKYTAAYQLNSPLEAIPLLEEAIALDSSFAMAHRRLAAMLSNAGVRPTRQIEAASKAYELRERLPEIERYHAIAYYEHTLRGNLAGAIEAYQRVLAIDSLDYPALNNMALRLATSGEPEEAKSYLQRAHQHGLLNATGYGNLAAVSNRPGQTAESERILNEGVAKFPQARQAYRMRWVIAVGSNRWSDADTAFQTYTTRFPPNKSLPTLVDLAMEARLRGRLDQADRYSDEINRRQTLPAERLEGEVQRAQQSLILRHDTARALRELTAALAATPLSSLDPYDRPYHLVATAYAAAGQTARADALLREYEQAIPAGRRGYGDKSTSRVRAAIALQSNDLQAALKMVQAARGNESCYSCIMPEIAHIYDRLGQADSALHYYEQYVIRPGQRVPTDAFRLPDVLLRLAQLYETRDPRKSIAYYTAFIERWRPADPLLQPRVREAEKRRAALVRSTG